MIDQIFVMREFAKQHNLIHSQEYIDFEDKLNAISTMDPRS